MMKINKYVLPFLNLIVLASCDHNVSMETTVHDDGKLEKVFVFENKDSSKNILGLSDKNGWEKKVMLKKEAPDSVKDHEILTTFTKSFGSAEQANAELAIVNDTLFQVTSTFERKFRWFYTYIVYSETYHALNRMNMKPDDYLVQEDYAFIDRLPAEGKKISKADEFYLSELQKRIYDVYFEKAYYEECYALGAALIRDNNLDKKWIDTLDAHKESVFNKFKEKKDMDDDFMLYVMDSLGVPVEQEKTKTVYYALLKKLDAKVNFISTANEGKFVNRINLPWSVVKTNADSVAGNSLFWAPSTVKFLVKDYTMYGECRRLNIWTVIVSSLVLVFTGYLFFRRQVKA